jgi:GAF domain-containing protein
MGFPPKCEGGGEACVPLEGAGGRHGALLRLSEALSQCPVPEALTRVVTEQLRGVLEFLHFCISVDEEGSREVGQAAVDRKMRLVTGDTDPPIQQRPSWLAYETPAPFSIHSRKTDERVPTRLKESIASQGLDIGPLILVPLPAPHRRLGALGRSGSPGTVYSNDNVCLLRLIGRLVASAHSDIFNLRRAEAAQMQLQRQNERLQQ